MTPQELQKKIDELAPWHYCHQFPNGLVTGTSQPDHYEKLDVMKAAGAFSRKIYRRVLDLGANSGLVSMHFAKYHQSDVLAVEAAPVFYEQLELAVCVKGFAEQISCLKADLTTVGLDKVSPLDYDCVLLLGVLHHIPVDLRQRVVNFCYNCVNHLGEVYIQTKEDIDAEEMVKTAGFSTIRKLCVWQGQNRAAWLCQKDPMKL